MRTSRCSRLIALVVGAVLGTHCSHPPAPATSAPEAVEVAVQAARVDTLRSTVPASGTVAPAPAGDWTITAPEQGAIVDFPLNEGDAVKTGDLLVRFEIPGLLADLSTRNAELTQASARVTAAKARATSLADLADRGIAPRKDVHDAQVAQAEAEDALKQVSEAQRAAAAVVDRATVKATFNGVVAKRWHNLGDQVGAAEPVLRVVDPSRAEIVAAVPSFDLPRVFVGRPANVSNPVTGQTEAAVVMTRPAAADTENATADVRLRFLAPTAMAIGTAVGVEIIADERPDALIVPAAAIVRGGGEVYVMVGGTDDKAHKRLVSLGLVTRTSVQVTDGLKAGEAVIVRGLDGVSDGSPITVIK